MKKFGKIVLLLLVSALALSLLCLASCDESEPQKETVQILFKADGITVAQEEAKPSHFNSPDYRIAPNGFQNPAGYLLDGWYSEDGVKYFDADGKKEPDLLIDRDMTLIANFTPLTYTLLLDAGEYSFADGSKEQTVKANYGEMLASFPVPVPSDPSVGFDGWFTEDGTRYSNGAEPVASLLTAENFAGLVQETKLVAVYAAKKFTLTLDYNDGSLETKTLTVGYGAPIGDLSAYGKDTGNECIVGWSVNRYNEATPPETLTEDIRLYAVWKPYKNIGFVMPNGETRTEKIFEDTQNRIPLPTLTAPGYILEGWYLTNSYSGNRVDEVHYSNMQETYYGKWRVTDYRIDFLLTEGATLPSTSYYYGDSFSLPLPSVPGYTFRGWYIDSPEESFYSVPETVWGDLTLTANLVPITYTLMLQTAGGRLEGNYYTVEYGSGYTIPVPEREGYTFLGWYDAAEGGQRMTGGSGVGVAPWSIPQDGCTLYAYWEIKSYVVSFETDGGSTVAPVVYTHGARFSLPEVPKKWGVLFDGWYTEDGTTEYTARSTVTEHITLYAKWIESTPVYDAEGLRAIANNPSGNYHLMNDINLDGVQWTPIAEFSGTLDGQGYRIHNAAISDVNTVNFLGFINTNKGTVRNLTMENIAFNYTRHTTAHGGVLIAANYGTVSNCCVLGGVMKYSMSVYDSDGLLMVIGSIAGLNAGVVENCYSNISISGTNTTTVGGYSPWDEHSYVNAGGIVGYNNGSGTLYACHSDATVYAIGSVYLTDSTNRGYAMVYAGGLAGVNDGRIEHCTSSATVSAVKGTVQAQSFYTNARAVVTHAGGAVGFQRAGLITQCYADATVHGACYGWGNIGGFAALQSGGEISNCYSTSAVSCNSNDNAYAAFVGQMSGGKAYNCYAKSRNYNTGCYSYGFAEIVNTNAVVIGCLSTFGSFGGGGGVMTNCKTETGEITEELIFTTLGWDRAVWEINEDGLPTLIGVEIPEEN